MLSTEEALRLVLGYAGPQVEKIVPLTYSAGYVLAEDIHSDIDMPPFDRSAMDGFAVCGDEHTHDLIKEITAGETRRIGIEPGRAAPIMTGAPIPHGADRVVMIEDCTTRESVLYLERVPPKGANICWRAEDITAGQMVLEKGTPLAQQHLGIAAMAGRGVLKVFGRPSIGILTTGTEVVPPTWIPSPGHVRNANLPLMIAQLQLAGFTDVIPMHAADDPSSIEASISQLLETSDVLVLAGGVSKGTRDFVPSVLESLGVSIHFRQVAQKPGKPLLFGSFPSGQPVFGLPGNPLSVMVSIEEYVLPLLRMMSGFKGCHKRLYHGLMTSEYSKKPGRLHYLRVLAYREGDLWKLHLPDTSGSGDLMSSVNVNALAMVGANALSVMSGDILPFHFLSSTAGELSFE